MKYSLFPLIWAGWDRAPSARNQELPVTQNIHIYRMQVDTFYANHKLLGPLFTEKVIFCDSRWVRKVPGRRSCPD